MNQPATYNKAVIPNSSVITDELSINSPIAIVDFQNNDNQAVLQFGNHDCRIEGLQTHGCGHLQNHSRNARGATESLARY